MNRYLPPLATTALAVVVVWLSWQRIAAASRPDDHRAPLPEHVSLAEPSPSARMPIPPGPGDDLLVVCRLLEEGTGSWTAGGTPIARARVGPSDDPRSIRYAPIATSDARGFVRATMRRDSSYGWTVVAAGYGPKYVVPSEGHADEEHALNVWMTPCTRSTVHVVDANDLPVAGVEVRITLPSHMTAVHHGPNGHALPAAMKPAVWSATTDATGEAHFADLVPTIYGMQGSIFRDGVELWRTPPWSNDFDRERIPDIVWGIGTACTIRGRAVEADGSPASGVEIVLEPAYGDVAELLSSGVVSERTRSTIADERGEFTIDFVESGDWTIGPTQPRGLRAIAPTDLARIGRPLRVPVGSGPIDVVVRVERGRAIRGRVLDPDGEPARRAGVILEGLDPHVRIEVHADREGRFEAGPLVAGRYELHATKDGFAPSVRLETDGGDADVLLVLRRGASVSGVVLDARSRLPAESILRIARLDEDPRVVEVVGLGASGAFDRDRLGAGTYSLFATTMSGLCGSTGPFELKDLDRVTALEILLERGASIRVVSQDPAHTVLLDLERDGVCCASERIVRGIARSFTIPPGHVTVRATIGDRAETTTVELEAGRSRDLVFDGAWK